MTRLRGFTPAERRAGRYLRDGEGHPADPPVVDPPEPVVEPVVEPPVDPVEPPAYEPLTPEALTFPEGAVVDEGLRSEFLTVLNNQDLTPAERAQELVNLHLKTTQQASDQSSAAWDTVQTQWQEQTRADPEIGGDKLEGVLNVVSKAVDKFGSPELRDVMTLTGAGNHPTIIKFIYEMAKNFEEGGPVSGAAASGGQTLADKMYPSMTKG